MRNSTTGARTIGVGVHAAMPGGPKTDPSRTSPAIPISATLRRASLTRRRKKLCCCALAARVRRYALASVCTAANTLPSVLNFTGFTR
jgi:hypothetical protein